MNADPQRVHELVPSEATLHGSFDPAREPVLTVASGDVVRYKTLDIGWGLEPPDADGERPRHPMRVPGIALVGPVAIDGAEPGMVLQADFLDVSPGSWGFTFAGGGYAPLDAALDLGPGSEELVRWQLDASAMRGRSEDGDEVVLAPFVGTIGMPDASQRDQSASPPRRTGGNMDCKEARAGSTLYLPIEQPRALVSIGDGHARQGDGEVAGMAIECPLTRVDVRYSLRTDLALRGPCIRTPEAWITLGFGETLDEAYVAALDSMLDHIAMVTGRSRRRALALASAVVDMRITQRANPRAGIHAVLPLDTLPSSGSPYFE